MVVRKVQLQDANVDRARAILARYHAGGDESSPLVVYELMEIERALQIDRESKLATTLSTLVKTAANRKRVLTSFILGFCCQWNGIGVISYYPGLVLDPIGITTVAHQALINCRLQTFSFAAAVFAGAMLVDRLGGRRLFLISTGGLCISYIAWTALASHFVSSHDEKAGRAMVAFVFITFFFYDIGWTPLVQAYIVEIYPHTTRSKGLTVSLISSYTSLITAQLIKQVTLRPIGWKYYIIFCCILAFLFAAICFLFSETKRRTPGRLRRYSMASL